MPAFVLGISAFYHDSAAALLRDGEIVAAAQEERFTRKKHDAGFPKHAVEFALQQAGIGIGDVDFVAFYDKPILKFHRVVEMFAGFVPMGFRAFARQLPLLLGDKLNMRRLLRKNLGTLPKNHRFVFPEHHESHAASAFYPSPFEEAAVLTMDGVGEWATTSLGVGEGNRLRLLSEIRFPHSLGLLYSAFTAYCGFKPNSGEYKLMGLAPYGEPRFEKLIRDHLIDLCLDGSYRLDMSYFGYCVGNEMTSPKFHALFGAPPRQPESQLEQRHMDLHGAPRAPGHRQEEPVPRRRRRAELRRQRRDPARGAVRQDLDPACRRRRRRGARGGADGVAPAARQAAAGEARRRAARQPARPALRTGGHQGVPRRAEGRLRGVHQRAAAGRSPGSRARWSSARARSARAASSATRGRPRCRA
jgi:hypothetical protein